MSGELEEEELMVVSSDGSDGSRRLSHRAVALGLLLLVAFAARAWPTVRPGLDWAKNNEADSNGYLQLAGGLAQGCGFARFVDGVCSAPEVLRTPGYPTFLWAFVEPRLALVAQAVAGTLVTLLVFVLVRRLWGEAAAFGAALLVGLDVTSIVWATQVMSEIPLQLLLAVAVALEVRILTTETTERRALVTIVLSATALALATLVKPIAMLLMPIMACFLAFAPGRTRPSRARLAAVAILLPALVVAAWTMRNASKAGVATFSAISAKNLYLYRGAGVVGRMNGMTRAEAAASLEEELSWPEGFSLQSEGAVQTQSAETIREMSRRGLQIVLDNPGVAASMTIRSFVYLLVTPGLTDVQLFLGFGEGYARQQHGLSDRFENLRASPLGIKTVVLFHWLLLGLTYVGVALAVLRSLTHPAATPPWIALLAVVALTLLAAAAGPEGGARLRVPAMPFLAMVGAVGFFRRPSR